LSRICRRIDLALGAAMIGAWFRHLHANGFDLSFINAGIANVVLAVKLLTGLRASCSFKMPMTCRL
jgi:hypothetical protein